MVLKKIYYVIASSKNINNGKNVINVYIKGYKRLLYKKRQKLYNGEVFSIILKRFWDILFIR